MIEIAQDGGVHGLVLALFGLKVVLPKWQRTVRKNVLFESTRRQ